MSHEAQQEGDYAFDQTFRHSLYRDAGRRRVRRMTPEEADDIAVKAFAFIASDKARARYFLEMTGTQPAGIRAASSLPGFSRGVMRHIAESDVLVNSFGLSVGLSPDAVIAAAAALGALDVVD